MQVIAVLGASENPERYSNFACELLRKYGHTVFAVSLHGRDIHGAAGRISLAGISEAIDTVTVYVSPRHQAPLIDEVIACRPRRVIFNPGAESEESERRLRDAGIKTVFACTLVLLKTGQFEK
jgi:predicted CoA-binding protein